jgi:hypothetical protein
LVVWLIFSPPEVVRVLAFRVACNSFSTGCPLRETSSSHDCLGKPHHRGCPGRRPSRAGFCPPPLSSGVVEAVRCLRASEPLRRRGQGAIVKQRDHVSYDLLRPRRRLTGRVNEQLLRADAAEKQSPSDAKRELPASSQRLRRQAQGNGWVIVTQRASPSTANVADAIASHRAIATWNMLRRARWPI